MSFDHVNILAILVVVALSSLISSVPVEAFVNSAYRTTSGRIALSRVHHRTLYDGMICEMSRKSHDDDSSVNADMHDKNDNNDKDERCQSKFLDRRQVLLQSAASAILLSTSSPSNANALSLPGIGSGSLSSFSTNNNNVDYQPSKRSTCYLVDYTMPPTLVPFRASREAAILKEIGSGYGTAKAAYLDESINLNNFMKKAVFGTIDGVSSLVNQNESKKKGPTFCFLGMEHAYSSEEDTAVTTEVDLALSLITDMCRPRARLLEQDTAIGLAFVPRISGQPLLDAYLQDGDETALLDGMQTQANLPSKSILARQLPILRFARKKGVQLLALGPEIQDLDTVRREGLQNVDLQRRSRYVLDTDGFINLTQDPKFKLYTDRSMLKDWRPIVNTDESSTTTTIDTKKDGPGDFFAQRILEDETIASSLAQWAVLRPENSFVMVLSDISHVRFLGGANGRVPRVLKHLNPDSPIDDDSVTTILLNPTAETTLSQSRFLRLEIGTAPENWEYQTKVADYLWFSSIPKVNMLPRMMRGS